MEVSARNQHQRLNIFSFKIFLLTVIMVVLLNYLFVKDLMWTEMFLGGGIAILTVLINFSFKKIALKMKWPISLFFSLIIPSLFLVIILFFLLFLDKIIPSNNFSLFLTFFVAYFIFMFYDIVQLHKYSIQNHTDL